jgi:hypothetical protein
MEQPMWRTLKRPFMVNIKASKSQPRVNIKPGSRKWRQSPGIFLLMWRQRVRHILQFPLRVFGGCANLPGKDCQPKWVENEHQLLGQPAFFVTRSALTTGICRPNLHI